MLGSAFVCFFLCVSYVGHWVCLFFCWGNYVGQCVCLVFCELCWALGLSVCWVGDLCWEMVVILGTSTAE